MKFLDKKSGDQALLKEIGRILKPQETQE